MEATANKTKETINESAKAGGKAFNDINTALMDMYSKQLNLAMGFYTNFLNSAMSNIKNWDQDHGYDMFQNSDLTKAFSNLFDNTGVGFQNPFLTAFTKIPAQLTEYNRNLLTAFTNEIKNNNADWTETSKKYKETMDSRLEAYRNIFKVATEAYNKHLDSSIEINKKMIEDINVQLNSAFKNSQKLWEDLLNTNKNSSAKNSSTEEDLKKESAQNEYRKKSNVPVNASDHK